MPAFTRPGLFFAEHGPEMSSSLGEIPFTNQFESKLAYSAYHFRQRFPNESRRDAINQIHYDGFGGDATPN
jgi:hypothetical protein